MLVSRPSLAVIPLFLPVSHTAYSCDALYFEVLS